MCERTYFMESEEESLRLDLKTDPETLKNRALWAGLEPGMRVADLGCGPGKTSYHLNRLVGPTGSVLGVDISPQRIDYARKHYADEGLDFFLGDIRRPLGQLGLFDFIWVRFVLEYYCSTSFSIVRNLSSSLKSGGILCLGDLDHNCLNHYGICPRLEKAVTGVVGVLRGKRDFDAYAGRKLYSYLFDLGYQDIRVDVSTHHLFYGKMGANDRFNWDKKLEVAARLSGYGFEEYEDGFEGFRREWTEFFNDPRRFTYTPIVSCRGRKP